MGPHNGSPIQSLSFPIPRVEDLQASMNVCRYYSKLDLNQAFFQFEISEESKELTTFYGNGRLLRLSRLPQGVLPASGELNLALRQIFSHIPEVGIIHDITIATKTQEQHYKVIEEVLKTFSEKGLTLKSSKCLFNVNQIPFWGMTISEHGIKPSPEDAAHGGLDAILAQGQDIHNTEVVACASRTTTSVERLYPQIVLEAMAIDFGLRRFREYCVGEEIIYVVTDHRPLKAIFSNRRLGSIRIDRTKLRHQDINYEVIWQPGKLNPSDYLSRHTLPTS